MTEDQAEARVQEIVATLRARGHRHTPQRLAVLRALVGSADHPSAEQVYHRLQPDYPMMSPGTVYKTIDTLKAAGEILELEFRDGPNRYDANIPSSHPHVMCTRCGRIEDIEIGDIDHLAQAALARSGFQVLRHRVDFYGLCPSCGTTAVSAESSDSEITEPASHSAAGQRHVGHLDSAVNPSGSEPFRDALRGLGYVDY